MYEVEEEIEIEVEVEVRVKDDYLLEELGVRYVSGNGWCTG